MTFLMKILKYTLTSFRTGSTFHNANITRTLSYVEKCRYTQELKNDDLECIHCIPQGKFLVFKGSQPLLKPRKSADSSSQPLEVNWLSYKDLVYHKPAVHQSTVLIDVDNDKTARFVVQLLKRDEKSVQDLEYSTGGTFLDLRVSLFMVGWNDGQILSRGNSLLRFHSENVFCARCGAKMTRNGSGCSRKCSECNTHCYPYANPVGIVLVTDPAREHALLVRQPRLPPGIFTCIAGFGDAGECLEATVKREVAEEAGLEVHSVEYVMSQPWPFPSSLMAGCYAVAEKSEISIDTSELDDGRWFTREEVGEALARITANPLEGLGDSVKGIRIPPPGAVAHNLIHHWYKRTPIKEIIKAVE